MYKILIFISLIINPSNCGLLSDVKNVYAKSKNILKNYKGSPEKMFLVDDVTLYPGTNHEFRQMHIDHWQKYYECLKVQRKSIRGSDKSITPLAKLVLEGNSIKLECQICLSPEESSSLQSIVWMTASITATTLSSIILTEHIVIDPHDKSLYLYNLQTDQSGQYSCQLGNTLTPTYYLTVVSDEPTRLVRPLRPNLPSSLQPAESIIIADLQVKVETEWGTWTPCNKCNQIGKKNRYGVCIVKRNTNSSENRLDTSVRLVGKFREGIPCRSHILPHNIHQRNEIQYRASEIMNAFCHEKCPSARVFEVRDEFGNVIETANNSAGIYSMIQGVPKVDPEVDRITVYGELDRPFKIRCPGNLNSDVPILWQIGSKIVVPHELAVESDGRVYVTNKDRIRINKLKFPDANIYSCWQHQKLAGTVRLIVTRRVRLDLHHYVVILGVVLLLGTFFYVYMKAYLGRKYTRF